MSDSQLPAPALGFNGFKLPGRGVGGLGGVGKADTPLTTINIKGFYRLKLWVGITKG